MIETITAVTVKNIEITAGAYLLSNNDFEAIEYINIRENSGFVFNQGVLKASELSNEGNFNIEQFMAKELNNITINNAAEIKITNSNQINLKNNVTINNLAGATILINSSGGLLESSNSVATLNNEGLIKKPSGASANSFYMVFDMNNSGILEVGENQTFLFLVASQSFINNADGILRGNGVFDITATFTNNGKIQPGGEGEIGTLTILNNIHFTEQSILEIDILDVANYDKLELFGAPYINGEIEINLLNTAQAMEDFTIITSSNPITGCNLPSTVYYEFDPFNIYVYNVVCNPNSVVLEFETILLNTSSFKVDVPTFYVYPNPASAMVTVHLKTPVDFSFSSEELSLSIIDILGKEVHHVENLSEGDNPLDVQNLFSGLYFVQLKAKNILISSSKMIIE